MFSFYGFLRFKAILTKEFIQMRNEYLTYISIIIIPLMQAVFFGYVINTDPKHLPTIVVTSRSDTFTQSIITGLENSQYFDIIKGVSSEAQAEEYMKLGKVEFVINIPNNFSRSLIRNEHPEILIEADATDPVAITSALRAANDIIPQILDRDLTGPLKKITSKKPSFSLVTHNKYNPEVSARYHSLPGLIAVVLASVLLMITAVSMASEYELGTFETLLSTPAKPLDIILGKLFPHFLIGYSILILLLASTYWLFSIPFYGSVILLFFLAAPYMLATLGVGLIASVISKTQLEAVTFANFYSLPSILLCGFVFPFYGMPAYAQYIGNLFPTTHFVRIIYGIMLKGSTFMDVWPDVWPLLVFLIGIIGLCALCSRKTLD